MTSRRGESARQSTAFRSFEFLNPLIHRLNHHFKLLIHLKVPEPHHFESLRLQPCSPVFVVLHLLGMLPPSSSTMSFGS